MQKVHFSKIHFYKNLKHLNYTSTIIYDPLFKKTYFNKKPLFLSKIKIFAHFGLTTALPKVIETTHVNFDPKVNNELHSTLEK